MSIEPWCFRPSCLLLVIASATATMANASANDDQGAEPTRIPLWQNGAPGTPATKPEDEPVFLVTRPAVDIATTTAVIVCPGGGYQSVVMSYEGQEIADWLSSFGVTAAVLKYRQHSTGHMHPVPMMDGQRAIRTVRARSTEWGIDPDRVGMMGFSAGGHLASTLGTHFDEGDPDAADPIERFSSRPDFMILCYPVISMSADFTHRGSRKNLLGDDPDPALVRRLSNEQQVTPRTPPTFLFHTTEDASVLPENSVAFYLALRRAGVPAELHIYQTGPHGVGLAKTIPGTRSWPDRCREWLATRGLLEPAAKK